MATRKRTIGDVGLPFKEDPKKDVLFAKPTDPPGGNVTTEQQWEDKITFSEDQLGKDNTDTYTGALAPPNKPKRQSGKETNDEWYSRMVKEKPDVISQVRESLGINRVRPEDIKRIRGGVELLGKGNGGGNANGTTPGGTGNVTTGINPNIVNPNGIVDNANNQVSAVTSGEDKPDENRIKLQQMIDELEARHKARMEENDNDLRRSQRNRLMTAIGDGLNAMHRAYSHSRGVQPMPGSERQMSKEWQDRYDRLKAERDRLNKDYLAEQLRIMQHGTAQQRADAYKDWMTRQGDAKQKNAETKAKVAEQENERKNRKLEQDLETAQTAIKKKEEEINILKEELDRIRHGLPKNPTAPRSSSGGGGGGKSGSSSRSNNSGGSGRQPSVGERAGAIIALDPYGWSAAQKAAGRKASQSTVLGIYNATHGGSRNKPQRGSKKTNVTWATRPK